MVKFSIHKNFITFESDIQLQEYLIIDNDGSQPIINEGSPIAK